MSSMLGTHPTLAPRGGRDQQKENTTLFGFGGRPPRPHAACGTDLSDAEENIKPDALELYRSLSREERPRQLND